MVYLIERNVNDGSSVSFEYDADVSPSKQNDWKSAWDLTEEQVKQLPDTIIISSPKSGKMPSVFGFSLGPYYLSEQLREIIETLEPDRHTFIPKKVKSTKPVKGVVEHGFYYLLYNPLQIDAVVIENTSFQQGVGLQGYNPEHTGFLKDESAEHYLKKKVVAGHHFWRGAKPFASNYFCSDQLCEKIRENGLTGWQFPIQFSLT